MAVLSHPNPQQFRGEPHFKSAEVTTTPGTEQTVLTDDAVPASKKRKVYRVVVTADQPGFIRIMKGADLLGSDRTTPAKLTACFDWVPPRDAATGDQVVVTFEQAFGPAGPLEVHLMAEDLTTT